jgi:hypothetical protein
LTTIHARLVLRSFVPRLIRTNLQRSAQDRQPPGTHLAFVDRMATLAHHAVAPSTHRTDRHASAAVIDIIRAEFREMPCLCLTLAQAMRLWSLDEGSCRRHLDALCRNGFLQATGGVYRRLID